MATLMDFVQDALREELVPGLRESLPQIDPVMGRLAISSKDVQRDPIGRDWKVIHTFDNTGVTGTGYTISPNGGNILLNGDPGTGGYSIMGDSQMTLYPTADQLTSPSFLRRILSLKKTVVDLGIPITLTQTDKLPGIGSMVDTLLKGFVRQINMIKLNAFWKLNVDNRIIEATIGGTTIPTTGTTFTVVTGRVGNLYNGMPVYVRQTTGVGTAASTTAKTEEDDTQPAFIDRVDYRNKTFIVKAHPSASAALGNAVAFTSGAVCAIYRYRPNYKSAPDMTDTSTAFSISGLENFIVDDATSTNVFNIDFSKYAQFRSWKDSSFTGALDSTALNKIFGGFMEAYGADAVDTIVTTDGVWLGMVDNIESTQQLLRYEVQGNATDIVLGTKGKLKYLFNGSELEVIQTKHCTKGVVWGLKLGNSNFKHYIPPPLPKRGTMKELSQEVEFIGQAIGYPSNIIPHFKASYTNTTDATHMPGHFYCEVVPDQLKGIKMSTFTENI